MRNLKTRAAVILIVSTILVIFAFLFSDPGGDSWTLFQPERKILHGFDGIRIQESTRGFVLERGAVIKSGAKVYCDLEFHAREFDSRIIISKNARAKMEFASRFHEGRNIIKVWLGEGEFYIKWDLRKADAMIFQVLGARLTGAERGGAFIAVRQSQGEVHALDGSVMLRPAHHVLDGLLGDFAGKTMGELALQVKQHAVTLAAGSGIFLPKIETGAALRKTTSPGQLVRIKSPAERRRLVRALERNPEPARTAAAQVMERKSRWPAISEPDGKSTRSRLKTWKQLSFSDKAAAGNAPIRANAGKKAAFVLDAFSNCVGRSLETLVLRNRGKHRGVILSNQDYYWVFDLAGRSRYPRNLVDRVEF